MASDHAALSVPDSVLTTVGGRMDRLVKVAVALPGARLCAVTQDCSSPQEVVGLVVQRQVAEFDPMTDDSDGTEDCFLDTHARFWMLRMTDKGYGEYAWEDFRPICTQCSRAMRGTGLGGKCTHCGGKKGKGNCFAFICSRSPSCYGCEWYCGSHPFFNGFAPMRRNSGHAVGRPLFKFEERMQNRYCSLVSVKNCAHTFFEQEEVSNQTLINRGMKTFESRNDVRGITCAVLIACVDQTLCPLRNLHETHTYLLVQRRDAECHVLHKVGPDVGTWYDRAPLPSTSVFFYKRMLRVSSTVIVGLAADGLWAMDLPAITTQTSAELARQLSWRKILALPQEASRPRVETHEEAFCLHRLLCRGPLEHQVVLFIAEPPDFRLMRPRILVEIKEDRCAKVQFLTSVAGVPCSRDGYWAERDGNIMAEVIRLNGYLFFNEFGTVYHLLDEAILPHDHRWIASDALLHGSSARVVTFRFPRGDAQDVLHTLIGPLARFSYFEKLFRSFREGASSEVIVTDVDVLTFGAILAYSHSGAVCEQLRLDKLVNLFEAANKYLIFDLAAVVLCRIIACLDNGLGVQTTAPEGLCKLLVLAEACVHNYPALQPRVVRAIVMHRSDIVMDSDFLRLTAAASATALAALMVGIHGLAGQETCTRP